MSHLSSGAQSKGSLATSSAVEWATEPAKIIDAQETQLEDLEKKCRLIEDRVLTPLSALHGTSFYRPILTIVVGVGFIFHGLILWMSNLQRSFDALMSNQWKWPTKEKYLKCTKSTFLHENSKEYIEDNNPLSPTEPPVSPLPAHPFAPLPEQSMGMGLPRDSDDDESEEGEIFTTLPAMRVLSEEDLLSQRLLELSEQKHASQLIFDAAARGDLATTSLLLVEGIDCDLSGPDGRSLAHVAAINDDVALLRKLSVCGSKRMWSQCSQLKTPLDYAALHGGNKAVTYLLSHAEFTDLTHVEQLSILRRTAGLAQSRGHKEAASILLDECKTIQLNENVDLFKVAVEANDLPAVERLLAKNTVYEQALTNACKKGYTEMASLLVSSMHRGFSYHTHFAIKFTSKEKSPDLVVRLLHGIKDRSERQIAARDAFQYALHANDAKRWKFLVESEELDVKNAFQVAARCGSLQTLQWLVDKQGKEAFHGDTIENAFQAAASCGSLHILKWLVDKQGKEAFYGETINRALHTILTEHSWHQNNQRLLLQFIFENGANINSKDEIWGSTLQHAAAYLELKVIEDMISRGADVNGGGKFGGTSPIVVAVSAGRLDVFHALLTHGARLENQGGSYGNVLRTACILRHYDLVEEILDRGFDVNSRMEPRSSPLMLAIQMGKDWVHIAELLVSRGADVNFLDAKLGTPLHVAAQMGSQTMVKFLVQAGASVNSKGGQYCTPLQAAAAKGHQLIAMFLLDSGAEINVKGGRHGSALKAAQDGDHTQLAKLLLFSGAKVVTPV